MTAMRLATLDLPEGNAMRAPGEAPGLMALEIAIDEMAEKLDMDPVAFRIRNDTQVDPENPDRRFTHRNLIGCLEQNVLAGPTVGSRGTVGKATGSLAWASPQRFATICFFHRQPGCGLIAKVSSPSKPT